MSIGQCRITETTAPDGIIYYYTEGAAAPMGDFQNYKREPRAVLVADPSLREESPGVFTRGGVARARQ